MEIFQTVRRKQKKEKPGRQGRHACCPRAGEVFNKEFKTRSTYK